MKKRTIAILIGCAAFAMLAVIALIAPRLQSGHSYRRPSTTGDRWMTASLAEVGMAEGPINELLGLLSQQHGQNINGLVVIKDGRLILEAYYPGEDVMVNSELAYIMKDFNRNTLHCLASASKSVTSILFGIAVDQRKVTDLDEKMFASFPEYAIWNHAQKDQITLRQMLTMTTGFPWDVSYPLTDPRNDMNGMYTSPDPVRFMLAKHLVARPGEQFIYNGGTTNLLGEILNRKTGAPLAQYAGEKLFKPLGITSYEWLSFPAAPQMAVASSLLYLTPRDMAKIGQLILQHGVWQDVRVVSAEWVEESTAVLVPLSIEPSPEFQTTGYGYQWWRGQFANGNTEAIYAIGWGGQFIFIMADIEMVVVLTGSNYTGSDQHFYNIVNRYILGSLYGVP